MKTAVVILSIVLLISTSLAQQPSIDKKHQKLFRRIVVGMSTAEVKAIIGNPGAIEGGFPSSSESIVHQMPDQAGQLNSSTWFYPLLEVSVTGPDTDGGKCYVNGDRVSKEIYDSYASLDYVYKRFAKVIDPVMGESFQKMSDGELAIVKKNLKTTYFVPNEEKTVTTKYDPVFCVIFDRGTQVVSACKLFFITPLTE